VFATAPVQRMARLRQTGLGYLTAPCSEHTRLVHVETSTRTNWHYECANGFRCGGRNGLVRVKREFKYRHGGAEDAALHGLLTRDQNE
jgi:hypothetical protein